jgi:hypothetical protein
MVTAISRAILCTLALMLHPALALGAAGAVDARSADNAYLDALQGDWDMSGTLLGKPVKYRAHGERVLQGGFLRLHMIDAAAAPSYEADLFLGYDARADDYIGHWLDRFGAAGARVAASGKRQGATLIIQFPYADGTFKDTFVYDSKSDSWTLLIESQAQDGHWSNFAQYGLAHTAPRAGAGAGAGGQQSQVTFGDDGHLHSKAEAPLPKTLSAQVQQVARLPAGLYRLTLNNGQVWDTTQADSALVFNANDAIVISRGWLGSYQISLAGRNTSVNVVRKQ